MLNENCTQAECTAGAPIFPHRYEIWTMSFPEGAAIHGCRPVVIVGTNEEYGQVTVVPLTSKLCYRQKPTHILIEGQGLLSASRGLGELVTTLPSTRLVHCIGLVTDSFDRLALRHALAVHLGLSEYDAESCICWERGAYAC